MQTLKCGGGRHGIPEFFGLIADERNESCASLDRMMRIIESNHAHHLSKSCASSEQIMRINGNNDADDFINPYLLTI